MSIFLGEATRRKFLSLAFWPHGRQLAPTLGLGGQSPEVQSMEEACLAEEHNAIYADDTKIDALMELARWYDEGLTVAKREGIEHSERTGVEHLVSFFLIAEHMLQSRK